MTTPIPEMIRILIQDFGGDLQAAAAYAERIATGAAFNPWADPAMAYNYTEAARKIRELTPNQP